MADAKARNAVDEMNRVLDVGPPVAVASLACDTGFTRRWGHGAIHDRTAPMTHHVAMTYFGAPQRIEWREGGRRESSITARGTITVIPAMHEARWDLHGPIEVSHVYVSTARLRACADAVGSARGDELRDRVAFDEPIASRLLEILAIEADAPDPSRRLAQEQTMDLLCMHLVQGSSVASTPVGAPRSRGLTPWQVKTITDYLGAHLSRAVGLDELSALVGLSRFHVCTAFRLATGMAPHQWLVHRRMTEAKRLLRDPSLSVTEVGFAVGYGSTSAFIAAFRKSTGVTPRRFRRQL